MSELFDAAIVGAGPAGATASILLARAGLHVALVEKQRFPRRKVCGECVAASNLPLLDLLGVGASFAAAAGPPLRQVALMRGDACIVAELPRARSERHAWGRALGRETFDGLLRDEASAAGVRIMQPWRAVALDAGSEAPRCVVRSIESGEERTLRARSVIVANGSWEKLGALRAHSGPSQPSDLIGFKANFRNAALAPGLLPVIAFRGGYGGMVVAEDDVATVACCIRRDHLQTVRRAAPGVTAGEAIERMLTREVWGVRLALADAQRCGPWISAGPLALGVHLSAGDMFFRIGNAAAEVHPIIGEGISMALQSAALLCARFIATIPPQCSQDRTWRIELSRWYARQWRRAFLPRLAMAALFANAAMRPALSATLWPLVRAWPALLTLGARGSGKIAPPALDPIVTNLSRDADSLID